MDFPDLTLGEIARGFDDLLLYRGTHLRDLGRIQIVVLPPSRIAKLSSEIQEMESEYPKARLIQCFQDDDNLRRGYATLRDAEKLTSVSLLPIDAKPTIWISVIRLALVGRNFIPASAYRSEPAAPRRRPETRSIGKLTERETEVLSIASDGAQNKLIAQKLAVSEHTVKLHMHHIIRKLGVRNRTEAAQKYLSAQQ